MGGEDGGSIQLQDCEVRLHEPVEIGGTDMCEETCSVPYSGETKSVKVVRESGHGEQQCRFQEAHGFLAIGGLGFGVWCRVR